MFIHVHSTRWKTGKNLGFLELIICPTLGQYYLGLTSHEFWRGSKMYKAAGQLQT